MGRGEGDNPHKGQETGFRKKGREGHLENTTRGNELRVGMR